ncbi:hypothetical protein BZA05DRAFT_236178 [Tricharina praecox]|uniref:uncharacterized protein n=1 Tax=Tricharina praecox TaxID=43433 RepID=UPI0022209C7D|nr:uncharacterized protein BZA05DRAFT_236178 [Tricharina praecox]KAI5855293.1 hypothetical protein BZA05DRAFT_236178 [Tricharina praecox]
MARAGVVTTRSAGMVLLACSSFDSAGADTETRRVKHSTSLQACLWRVCLIPAFVRHGRTQRAYCARSDRSVLPSREIAVEWVVASRDDSDGEVVMAVGSWQLAVGNCGLYGEDTGGGHGNGRGHGHRWREGRMGISYVAGEDDI